MTSRHDSQSHQRRIVFVTNRHLTRCARVEIHIHPTHIVLNRSTNSCRRILIIKLRRDLSLLRRRFDALSSESALLDSPLLGAGASDFRRPSSR